LGTASNDSSAGNYHATTYGYDGRGDLIKVQSPTGLVAKSQYDGVGRLVLAASTDGGSDTSCADAGNLTGDTVLEQIQYD